MADPATPQQLPPAQEPDTTSIPGYVILSDQDAAADEASPPPHPLGESVPRRRAAHGRAGELTPATPRRGQTN